MLPVCDQPWFDGSRTPKELILAWEQASCEDWVRFDACRRKERKAQEKAEAKWTAYFIIVWFLVVVLAMVFR